MRYEIDGEILINIANAIRSKNNTSELLLPVEMPTAIEQIMGDSDTTDSLVYKGRVGNAGIYSLNLRGKIGNAGTIILID